jgi:hypothetical protein
MGFFSYAGQGAAGGMNNIMKMIEQANNMKLEREKLAQQKALQDAQAQHYGALNQHMSAQNEQIMQLIAESKRKAAAEELMGARERNAVLPQYPPGMMGAWESYPEETVPLSDADMIRNLARVNPQKYATQLGQLATKENNINPMIAMLIKAAQDGTINEQGKAILKMAGYDLFAPKQGPLITGPGGVRVPDVPGAETADKTKPRQLKGFDKKTNVAVYNDPQTDELVLADGTPYKGGQLKPVTEPGTVTVLNQATAPADMEKLADAVEAGRNTLGNIAKGMGGSHTAREVSLVLEGRGVDVASLDVNLAAKRQALGALEKTVNQLKPFEETARRNLNYAKSISKEYLRTQYPDLNKLKQIWDTKTGDPLIEKFKVATYDGIMESMKHMLAGSGITAQELSIGAQKKADELISTAKTWQQFDAIVEAINVGLVNRANAYKEQLEKLKRQSIVNFTPPENIPTGDTALSVGGGIPQGAIDRLKKNPHEAALFEMTFGKGSSRQYLGGK